MNHEEECICDQCYPGPRTDEIRSLIAPYQSRLEEIKRRTKMASPILWAIDRDDIAQRPGQSWVVVFDGEQVCGASAHLCDELRERAHADLHVDSDQEWWLQYHEHYEEINSIISFYGHARSVSELLDDR